MSGHPPENTVTIRSATPADVASIHALILELAEYERLRHEVLATSESLNTALFGSKSAAEAIVAEMDGIVVGYALFFTTFSTFVGRPGLYLEDIYVQPCARGHGIGRRLLAEVARLAVERQCGRLEWAVLDWNEPAIAFYRKLGARAMADWTVFRLADSELESLAKSAPCNP